MSEQNPAGWMPFGYTEQFDTKDKYMVFRPLYSGKTPLRLGIVGMGGVAQGKHIPALLRLGIMGAPIQLTCFCELNEEVGAKISTLMNCRHYTDYETMLREEALDAVSVLIPPGNLRYEVIHTALSLGLHVFAEKPLLYQSPALLEESLAQVQTLIELARKKGLVFNVGFSKRFAPPYYNARLLIQDGRIGKISMVNAKMCQGWSKANLLENQCCHMIDQLRYLVGDVSRVYAVASNRFGEKNYPIDNLCATLEFQNGAIGTVSTNSSNPSLKPWERIEVYGEQRWLGVEDSVTLTLHDSETGPSQVWQPVWPNTLLLDPHFSGFVDEIQHFCACVRGECASMASAVDGYRALEIACALHRSYENHCAISLPVRDF